MGPISYDIGNLPDPQQAFMQGLQQGNTLLQLQQQRQQQQAQQMAMQRVQSVLSNPNATHDDLISVIGLMDPKVSAEVLKAREAADKERAQAAVSHGMQTIAALRSSSPEYGVRLLEDRATALENSGRPQEAARFREAATMAKADPIGAANFVGIGIAGLPGAKEAYESLAKLNQDRRDEAAAPYDLAKKAADARAAASEAALKEITAKYGEQTALLDLQKKGWDIRAVTEDIEYKRQANRIAAMNAATAREGNSIKREELKLKIAEAQGKLDDKLRERVATAQSGAAQIDNMLNTVERIKRNPSLDSVLGTVQGRLPALVSDEASDAIALIETLGSQAFLAQIPNIKGMGALSNAEGEKLQSALTSLSRTQSEEQFRANLDEAARLLNKGRENLSRATGVPLGKPDTPAAPGARPPLASFNR